MRTTHNLFEKITSPEHLFKSWDQFKRGKRKRKEIQEFEHRLEDHIFELQSNLATLQYQHGSYDYFTVSDPKQRQISKAHVRDRLVHQAVYQVLSDLYDPTFIFHSLSSRLGKGTHFGVLQLHRMIRKSSKNGTLPCFALKLDIKRFFDSVNHSILKDLICKKIQDEKTMLIVDQIIDSFHVKKGIGIPLGNVTSQLFANIYLHELDDFIKQDLHEKYYVRYCDDFIILSNSKTYLESLIPSIQQFLIQNLHLELHPKKITIRKLSQGIDFVGYVLFQTHTLLRTRTKQRMKKRMKDAMACYLNGELPATTLDQKLHSYLGILSHANQHTLSQALKNAYWVRS